jgi:hypothetical protein
MPTAQEAMYTLFHRRAVATIGAMLAIPPSPVPSFTDRPAESAVDPLVIPVS